MTRLTEDIHDGFSGGHDKNNIYTLALKRHDKRLRHFVVAEVYNNRDLDSNGMAWLRKKRVE